MPSRPGYFDPKVAGGRTVYVSNEETGEMSVDGVATGTIRRVMVGGEPEGLTIRPDGRPWRLAVGRPR